MREAIGAVETEAITYLALEQFTRATGHARAAELILASAADLGPELEAQVRQIFEQHGFGACERATEYRFFRARVSGLPHLVEGSQSAGVAGLRNGTPAYKQFYVDVAPETEAVQLRWAVSAGGQMGFGGFGGGGQPSPLELAIRKTQALRSSRTVVRFRSSTMHGLRRR